ncbi:hypothetical protein Tco_0612820 [Tanacetum coccineum]
MPPSFRGLGRGEGDLFRLSLLKTLEIGDGLSGVESLNSQCYFHASFLSVRPKRGGTSCDSGKIEKIRTVHECAQRPGPLL